MADRKTPKTLKTPGTPWSPAAPRAVAGLSFTDMVPLDALLGALAADAPPVAARLQRLLLPSFLPGPEAGPACLAQLLRASPQAGRAFCACLAGEAGAMPCVKDLGYW